jgi:hypothetical protein
VLGVALAFIFKDWDQVPIKRYEWEDDDSVPDWFPEAPDRGEDARFSDEGGRPRGETEPDANAGERKRLP